MKKIICFTSNLSGGGAEHQMSILANLLVERNYDVTIVTYNTLPDHYILDSRIKRVRLDVDGKGGIVKQLIISRYILSAKADCVISFRSTPNFILLWPLLFRPFLKVIVSERNVTLKPNTRERINYNFLYHRANYIVPNSHTQNHYLKKLDKAWKDRVVTITNYTDLNEFVPVECKISDEVIQIGIFARIFPQKNYERFCEMLSLLKQRTKRKFMVHWYGDKREGKHFLGSNHIHKLIEELQISDVLQVHEAVKNVSHMMCDFHAMCLPSLFEGFSNSISEYICCGKVVLCSDVSDNSTMVREGINGFLFNPYDVESMCLAFERFFSLSCSQITEMEQNSRNIAEELFDKERFIQSYISLIEG